MPVNDKNNERDIELLVNPLQKSMDSLRNILMDGYRDYNFLDVIKQQQANYNAQLVQLQEEQRRKHPFCYWLHDLRSSITDWATSTISTIKEEVYYCSYTYYRSKKPYKVYLESLKDSKKSKTSFDINFAKTNTHGLSYLCSKFDILITECMKTLIVPRVINFILWVWLLLISVTNMHS